jgi:hypothetical protein
MCIYARAFRTHVPTIPIANSCKQFTRGLTTTSDSTLLHVTSQRPGSFSSDFMIGLHFSVVGTNEDFGPFFVCDVLL